MSLTTFSSSILQLPAQRGGYYYITVASALVNTFSKGKKQRLICTINNYITINCGLNPLGDGNYFIIIASKHIKVMQINVGHTVTVAIEEDTNPLGVAVPEVLEALLEQDELLNKKFEALTDGKKRSIVFAINKIKNIDTQIQNATKLILNGVMIKKKTLD